MTNELKIVERGEVRWIPYGEDAAVSAKPAPIRLPDIVGVAAELAADDTDKRERLALFRIRWRGLLLVAVAVGVAAYGASDGEPVAGLLAFVLAAGCGWLWLVSLDSRFSAVGVQVQRNSIIYSLSVVQMQTTERLRMAELNLQQMQLKVESLRASAAHVQASAIESQSVGNGLGLRLSEWLLSLYDGGIDEDGRITKTVLWSARGGLSPSDRKAALSMLNDWGYSAGAWLVAQRRNSWYLNVDRFPTPNDLRGCVGVCVGVQSSCTDDNEGE